MKNNYPTSRDELIEQNPHLIPINDFMTERLRRYAEQRKELPSRSEPLGTAHNIRTQLKKDFPGTQFSVRADGSIGIVSWTQWSKELGGSPSQKQVNDALEWFRHWPSDTTCNETRPAEEYRKLFNRTFGGFSRIEFKPMEPTAEQLARKKKSVLNKLARENRKVKDKPANHSAMKM